ncbi:MAG: shikimate kinase [Candidatus Marinimicrobia bacterium]|nr:shikimate kinase [Candidatus Neomarinimicrobiota bacterium]
MTNLTYKIPITINIFLIGMMGSWKSTVGRKLADALNLEFIDTDDAIEEVTEMKVVDIFREFGEEKFREMETAFFVEKAKKFGQLFSTGGGIVLSAENRNVLQKNGITFLLDASPQTLANRIHNTTKRPLLTDSDNLEDRLQKIWDERHQYYLECARHVISTDEMEPPQVLDEILKILEVANADH